MAERRPFYRFEVVRHFVTDDETENFGDYDSVRIPRAGATILLRWLNLDGTDHWGEPAGRVRVVSRIGNVLHVVPRAASVKFIRHVQRKVRRA